MRDATYGAMRRLLDVAPADRALVLRHLPARDVAELGEAGRTDWPTVSRLKQRLPAGSWRWLLWVAGRSWGKTRSGAEAIREKAESGLHEWLSIVAPTAANLLRDCIGGPSGVVTISPRWFAPTYLAQKNVLVYPRHPTTGITCRVALLSADKPDRIRGSQASFIWADEVGAWPKAADAFANVDLSLRLGPHPQGVVSMTPRPSPFVKDLVLGTRGPDGKRRPRPDVLVVKGTTFENRSLASTTLDSLRGRYAGTATGKQELEAEILESPEGALWQQETDIDAFRVDGILSPPVRFVVAVDPSRSAQGVGDACGIIVACKTSDGHVFVLEDLTTHAGVQEWALRAAGAANRYRCDIVYEQNRLSFELSTVLRQIAAQTSTRWTSVTSSESKQVRAEPVALLYRQGRVHHLGNGLELLENEMTTWDASDPRAPSPNRVDALVHAVSALALGKEGAKRPLVLA